MRALSSPRWPSARSGEWRGPKDFRRRCCGPAAARRRRRREPGAGDDHSPRQGSASSITCSCRRSSAARAARERRLLRWIDLPRAMVAQRSADRACAARRATGARAVDALIAKAGRERAAHERGGSCTSRRPAPRDAVAVRRARSRRRRAAAGPDARTLLAHLWPALAERFAARSDAPALPRRRPAAGAARPSACSRHGDLARAAGGAAACAAAGRSPVHRARRSSAGWARRSAHIGTVVHGWLARLAHGAGLPGAPRRSAEHGAAGAGAAAPPGSRSASAAAPRRARRHRRHAHARDERGRWMLDRAASRGAQRARRSPG